MSNSELKKETFSENGGLPGVEMNRDGINEQKESRNARDYAQTLQLWLWQYRMSSALQAVHLQMLSMLSTQNALNISTPTTATTQPPTNRGSDPSQRQQSLRQVTNVTYKIPMLWKRVAAEVLDFVLLFYIKILVTVAVLRQMGYMTDSTMLELELPDNLSVLFSDLEQDDVDYERLFSFTSELVALEIVNRALITIVETLCLRKGFAGTVGGATPGKKILGLRVISFSEIHDQFNGSVLVTNPRDPGLMGAFIRSMIKNFSMAFFFPACFTVFFFRFHRAAYDVIGQTLVVEVDRALP